MAGFDEPFDAWLSARLGALDLDADVYAEYVSGILADEDMPLDERAEQASQLVAAALDEEYAAAAAGLETATTRSSLGSEGALDVADGASVVQLLSFTECCGFARTVSGFADGRGLPPVLDSASGLASMGAEGSSPSAVVRVVHAPRVGDGSAASTPPPHADLALRSTR